MIKPTRVAEWLKSFGYAVILIVGIPLFLLWIAVRGGSRRTVGRLTRSRREDLERRRRALDRQSDDLRRQSSEDASAADALHRRVVERRRAFADPHHEDPAHARYPEAWDGYEFPGDSP